MCESLNRMTESLKGVDKISERTLFLWKLRSTFTYHFPVFLILHHGIRHFLFYNLFAVRYYGSYLEVFCDTYTIFLLFRAFWV